MTQLWDGQRAQGSPDAFSATDPVVVLLDPEVIRAGFIEHALRRRFPDVIAAASLAEAEARIERQISDCLVLILCMEDHADLAWAGRLRVTYPSLALIVVSDQPDVDDAVAALRAGAADYLARPFGVEQLVDAIDRVLAKRPPHQGEAIAPAVVRRGRSTARTGDAAAGLVGECKPVKEICRIIERVAPMPSTVLVKGESGTGKELAALAIHERSGRTGEFVPINCGAMSTELLESELFGHVRGAFTGAHQARDGLFRYADGGTLFLDEIGEMPLGLQAKLLRVLEEKRIRPVGGNEQIAVDARIIAATNRNLLAEVRAGRFREDLYYRLNVLEVRLPPLRERRDDIPALARYFVETLSAELGVAAPALDEQDLTLLCGYRWPGNVRELRNLIERCLLLGLQPRDCMHVLGAGAAEETADAGPTIMSDGDRTLETAERRHIQRVLQEANGNRNLAAVMLGVSRKTVERKLRQWALQDEDVVARKMAERSGSRTHPGASDTPNRV